jgi:hypothetical protein
MKNAIAGLVTAFSMSALAAATPARAGSGDVAPGSSADSPRERLSARRWRPGLPRSMWHRRRSTWWNRNATGHAADPCGTAIVGFGPASRSAIERAALDRFRQREESAIAAGD